MGAKGSTASGGHQSPRTRTFSTSSSTDVVSAAAAPGFNLLRTLPGVHVQQSDRQRARSLSAVPDLQTNSNNNNNNSHHNHHGSNNHNHNHDNESGLSTNQRHNEEQMYGEHNRNNRDNAAAIDGNQVTSATGSSANAALALGRVYTATSLPSHIWSLNGLKCPVCSKFILPDDIECHLVMCLTKPRLSYNEDVLVDAKGECVICLEELNPGDIIARLPCLCIYHKGCIDRWFEVNRCCPEHPGD